MLYFPYTYFIGKNTEKERRVVAFGRLTVVTGHTTLIGLSQRSIANRGSRFVNEFHILQAAFSDNRNCKICGLHNFFAIRSGLCYNFYIGVRKISDLKGDYL